VKIRELVALVWEVDAGRVLKAPREGRLEFIYEDSWTSGEDSVPLSLSLPLAARVHGHDAIDVYLRGLLPDNERILERWASKYHVSARNAFALIAEVGEECPGAVQFLTLERADLVRKQPRGLQVKWLEEKDVENRIIALNQDQAAWRLPEDTGQFSLAGTQPKTALLRLDGRWGVPSGRTPTTHILKPPIKDLNGHAENEHICLLLARAAGLAAANSEIRRFGKEVAIVVERYDRIPTVEMARAAEAESATSESIAWAKSLRRQAKDQPIQRLHQEDLCQALGIPPTRKYQNEGGPTPAQIADVLREHSSRPQEDIPAFVDALAFNWLIGGTDAHAKNYSLLHGRDGRVRLAPLYDVSSVLPYPRMNTPRVKLAMKIGGEYVLKRVTARHWAALSEELKLDQGETLRRIVKLSRRVAVSIPGLRSHAIDAGLDHPLVGKLLDLIASRTANCLRDLERT
jgi:serine/threonine-protein kinase HipA